MRAMALCLLGVALLPPACAGPRGRPISADEYRQLEREWGSETGGGRDGVRETERLEDLAKERTEQERALRDVASRRERLAIEHLIDKATATLDVEKAERELRFARDDLRHFEEVERERRLRADALELQETEDRLRETREELAQLELMYGESALGDATAEIVLARTRRRLALAELRYEVRQEESAELARRTLPRELDELRAEVTEKEVALQNARRGAEVKALEREAALRELDDEESEARKELQRIEREEEKVGAPG